MRRAHYAAALAVLLTAAPLAAQQTGGPTGAPSDETDESAVPGSHRHFFIPTGRTLPAGTAEAGAYQIAAPYVGYAFHDRVMVAAGTPLVPQAFGRYWYITPKLGLLRGPRWNASVGGLILTDLGAASFAGGDPLRAQSVGWGVVTSGGSAGGITLGAATNPGAPFGVPGSWLVLTGAELRVIGDDRGVKPDVVRLVYESYLDSHPERALEGLHVAGARWRAGQVAVEVGMPISVDRYGIEASGVPLIHASVIW